MCTLVGMEFWRDGLGHGMGSMVAVPQGQFCYEREFHEHESTLVYSSPYEPCGCVPPLLSLMVQWMRFRTPKFWCSGSSSRCSYAAFPSGGGKTAWPCLTEAATLVDDYGGIHIGGFDRDPALHAVLSDFLVRFADCDPLQRLAGVP